MNVLVINAGSSSLKYQLLNVETHTLMAKGICERVGSEDAFHKHGWGDTAYKIEEPIMDHVEAVGHVLKALTDGPAKVIDSFDEIQAVGHRIVQGGSYFDRSVLITDEVIEKIDELAELAPLHNKAALSGIDAIKQYLPDVPMVAVFDTSFFANMPPRSFMYALPYELYEKYGIRKYGAHGTSHRYIAERAADLMDEDIRDLRLITCHLGNGCSISAVDHGLAVDTSMGMTPLDGLMMGTRCGSIDPAVVTFIMEHEHLDSQQMLNLMNKESGLLGISGLSNDLRAVRDASEAGNERCQLAYEMYANAAKRYIGQYIAVMGGVDAVILTAGVGENCEKMRRMIFSGLQTMGIKIDFQKNREGHGTERVISTDDSETMIFVIPTDEEYMIAKDTYEIVHDRMHGITGY